MRFLAFDGHCYMYRAVKRALERQAARALPGRGEPALPTTRPRRLLEGDALVLSALEIIAHFDPLMWVIENPATGLLKTRPFMRCVDVTYCKHGTPYRKQTRLWTNMRWRPRRSLRRPGLSIPD